MRQHVEQNGQQLPAAPETESHYSGQSQSWP